jgi:arsenite-transporting ATPase
MRTILYTGKGGVGKTTLSAATAVACAKQGRRTVVMSIDAAHSLGDSFDTRIGSEPTPIIDNLHALEIDVHHELERNWNVISTYIKRFLTSQGYDEVVAEELVVMPGMEELFSLLKLLEFKRSGEYDLAVIDCAPTGSTLQFLGFSDVLDWYMTRFFNLERRIVKTVKPIAEKIIKAPLPTDEVFGSVEGIYARIIAIKELLMDPDLSSVRIVTN